MEYEYSCKVKDLLPFIKYCLNNNYELKDEYEQTRILYKNDGKVMARITRNKKINEDTEILDFKEDNLDKEILKIRKESKSLTITDDNREFVESLLDILELKETKKLIRKRFIYVHNNVKFELDEYRVPLMNVLAIEGKKEEVDIVYNSLKSIIDNNIVKE